MPSVRGSALGLVAAALALAAAPAVAVAPPRCKIDHVGAIAFGGYNPFSPLATDALGAIGYDCSSTPGPIISIATGSSGTYAGRTLRQGGSTLAYQIYVDAGHTIVFGDGSAGTQTIDATNQRKQTLALFGRIFPQQMAPRGTYTDALVVTISF